MPESLEDIRTRLYPGWTGPHLALHPVAAEDWCYVDAGPSACAGQPAAGLAPLGALSSLGGRRERGRRSEVSPAASSRPPGAPEGRALDIRRATFGRATETNIGCSQGARSRRDQ